MLIVLLLVVLCSASEVPTAATGQIVSVTYEIGQELGFGRSAGDGGESYVNSEIVDRLRREAANGKKDAQYYLGVVLYYGDGVGKDVPAAIKSFRKAAEQDHVQAMINLGVIYNEGHEGSPPDRKAAAVWLGRAASHNDADAQWLLGKLHYDGHIGDKPDMFEAMKLFRSSAEQGNPHGQFYVGLLTEYGFGTPRNFRSAAVWYQKASEQKHIEATYNLGLMYTYGRGLEKNFLHGSMLFDTACAMSHGPACLMLATMNWYGNGFSVDYNAALVWMKKAIATGDARVKEQAEKGAAELSDLLERAAKYYDDARKERPPPKRLDYVRLPKSREGVEKAKKIAAAVGDAQARALMREKHKKPDAEPASSEL